MKLCADTQSNIQSCKVLFSLDPAILLATTFNILNLQYFYFVSQCAHIQAPGKNQLVL